MAKAPLFLACTVLATGRIEAGVGYQQAFHWLITNNVRLNDFFHVGQRHFPVPDALRIDNHGRAVFALIEASRLVCSDLSPNSALGQLNFERTLQLGGASRVAATAGMTWWPLIGAYEDVLFELSHVNLTCSLH